MSVFLGFLPDATTTAALAALQAEPASSLATDAPRHNWRTPPQWHMTLAYLGDALRDGLQARIADAIAPPAAQASALSSRFKRLQYWPHANVLVARFAKNRRARCAAHRFDRSTHRTGFRSGESQGPAARSLAHLPKDTRVPPQAPSVSQEAVAFRVDNLHLLATRPGHHASLHAWPLGAGEA